jgi:ankyrin repeat protein
MNDEQFRTILGYAESGNRDKVTDALEKEPALATRASDATGTTILHMACRGGHVDLVRDLLDLKADVNRHDRFYGLSPIMYAALGGSIPVMELLLLRGADTTAQNNSGYTVLHMVLNSFTIFEFLVSAGADLNATDKDGMTPEQLECNGRAPRYDRDDFFARMRTVFANGPHPSQVLRRNAK